MPSSEQLKSLLDALAAYQQDQQTLQPIVDAAQAIYGQDWTAVLTNELETVQGIDPATLNSLKEKANHAIHYYGALAAWEEAHQYLNATDPVDPAVLEDRLPTLEYWLALFGDEGNKVVAKLRQLLANISPVLPSTPQPVETAVPVQETQITETVEVEQAPVQEDIPIPSGVEVSQEQPETDMASFTREETQIDMGQPLVTDTNTVPAQEDILQTQEDIQVYPESISEDTILTEEDILDTPALPSQEAEPVLSQPAYTEDIVGDPLVPEPEEIAQPEQTYVQDENPSSDIVYEQDDRGNTSVEADVFENRPEEMPQTSHPVVTEVVEEAVYKPQPEAAPIIQETVTVEEETPKNWEIANYLKEKALYEQVVAWATAKCIHMGNIELTAYPHYGFIVDMMRSLKENIQNLLDNQLLAEVIEQQLKDGRKGLEDFLKVIDTELAHLPEIESQPAENIIEGVDARSILGQIDTSNTKEYLGPAPDGFELMDDPYAKEEEASKEELLKAYEQTEANMSDSISRLDILEEGVSQPAGSTSTSQKG